MQRLVDPAVVIEAMVIPALALDFSEKSVNPHSGLPLSLIDVI
jgi:hypothetical protein